MGETEQSFSPELCRALRDQGLRVGVRNDLLGCERDTRLHVGLPSAASQVELLGPLGDGLLPPRWQAVRVEGGRRSVWEGPSRQGSQAELRAFLWDLACLQPERVLHRWRRLG